MRPAQGAATAWGVVPFTSIGEVVNSAEAAGFAALSRGVLSVLTSMASSRVGDKTPSLTDAEVLPDAA